MSQQFIHRTSGWIPVFVLSLLTTALIAGQSTESAAWENVGTRQVSMTHVERVSGDQTLDLASIYQSIEQIKARFALQMASIVEPDSEELINLAVKARPSVGH